MVISSSQGPELSTPHLLCLSLSSLSKNGSEKGLQCFPSVLENPGSSILSGVPDRVANSSWFAWDFLLLAKQVPHPGKSLIPRKPVPLVNVVPRG